MCGWISPVLPQAGKVIGKPSERLARTFDMPIIHVADKAVAPA